MGLEERDLEEPADYFLLCPPPPQSWEFQGMASYVNLKTDYKCCCVKSHIPIQNCSDTINLLLDLLPYT